MKFEYEYRTCDNERKSGMISARDREAVFVTLKAQGINPSRVREAPGVFNRLFGKGKRYLVIAFLGIICLALAVALS